MPYRLEVILMTLNDLQGHSPTANLFKVFRTAVQQLTRFQLTACCTVYVPPRGSVRAPGR